LYDETLRVLPEKNFTASEYMNEVVMRQ
jgi:hypothetical protein